MRSTSIPPLSLFKFLRRLINVQIQSGKPTLFVVGDKDALGELLKRLDARFGKDIDAKIILCHAPATPEVMSVVRPALGVGSNHCLESFAQS
jgi:hypothetical protein